MSTKSTFEATARILRGELTPNPNPDNREDCVINRAVGRLARAFADHYATENARFDRARFLAACGVES